MSISDKKWPWLLAGLLLLLLGPLACRHESGTAGPRLSPVAQARKLTRAGRPAEAYERFLDILESDPRDLSAHRGLVEAAYYAGCLSEVAGRYERMAERESTAGLGAYGMGLVAMSRGPGFMQEALRHLSRAAEIMSGDAEPQYRMGLIHLLNGDNTIAKEFFEKALAIDPDRAAILVAYGSALMHLKRERKAIEVMSRILTLSPAVNEISKARTIAAKIFDPVRGCSPETAQDLKKVIDLLDKDYVQQALFEVDKTLVREPENALANTLRGLAHSRLENNGEAIVSFEKALKKMPDAPLALVGLGDVYARLEKWGNARKNYEKAILLNPFDLEAHQRMGELARVRRDHDQAASSFGVLVMLDPQNTAYRHQHAMALFKAGRPKDAISVYESILTVSENDLESLVRLGSLYAALSKAEPDARERHLAKARGYVKRAIEINPENEAVKEMLVRLED